MYMCTHMYMCVCIYIYIYIHNIHTVYIIVLFSDTELLRTRCSACRNTQTYYTNLGGLYPKQTYIYIYIYICTYIHVYAYTHVCVYIYIYIYIYIHTYTCIYIYIYVYMYMCTYIYIYIYIYTHTFLFLRPGPGQMFGSDYPLGCRCHSTSYVCCRASSSERVLMRRSNYMHQDSPPRDIHDCLTCYGSARVKTP